MLLLILLLFLILFLLVVVIMVVIDSVVIMVFAHVVDVMDSFNLNVFVCLSCRVCVI